MKIILAIPCYNEEAILEKNIKQIAEAAKKLPYNFEVVISDNASGDRTAEIGKRLAAEEPPVKYFFVAEMGKGAAVMDAWKNFEADVYGFMDADLSTDLSSLPEALSLLEKFDAVIGSRRIKGSEVKREKYRKLTSGILNFLIRAILKTKIKDTPCGFKFFKKGIIEKILPQVKDRKWVFDTEILILAERADFKIKELPVKWEERGERKSRVNVSRTARGYLKNIWELRRRIKNYESS